MCQIDVTADLILAVDVVPDEDDRGHTAIANQLLTLSKCFKKRTMVNLATGMRKCFRLVGLFVFLSLGNSCLSLKELFTGQDFALAVVPNLDQLSC